MEASAAANAAIVDEMVMRLLIILPLCILLEAFIFSFFGLIGVEIATQHAIKVFPQKRNVHNVISFVLFDIYVSLSPETFCNIVQQAD